MLFNRTLFYLLLIVLFIGCTKYSATKTTTPTTSTGGTGSGTGSGSGSSGSGGSTNTSGNSGTGPIIISYIQTSPCSPSTEKFTFTCTGSGVPTGATFEWYFGDGNAGYTSPVDNVYTDGGNKTVLVKVKKDGNIVGQQSMSVRAFGQDVSPIASYSYNMTNQVGTQATFDFQSNSYIAKGSIDYLWTFPDSTKGYGIKYTKTFIQQPINQTLPIKLKVTSDAGCSNTKTINVVIPAAYNIGGGFSAVSTSPCLPSKEIFTFNGPTINVPQGAVYTWDFGDGAGITTGNPVSKAYVNANSYNVIMTIVFNGKDIYKVGQPIKTFGQDATPIPSFYIQFIGSVINGYTYNFNNTSQIGGGYSNINWDC